MEDETWHRDYDELTGRMTDDTASYLLAMLLGRLGNPLTVRIAELERENAAYRAQWERARIILADLARYGVGDLMPAEHVAAARALLAEPQPPTD